MKKFYKNLTGSSIILIISVITLGYGLQTFDSIPVLALIGLGFFIGMITYIIYLIKEDTKQKEENLRRKYK